MIRLVLDDIASGMSRMEVSKKYDIKSSSIGNWVNKK